MAQFLVGEKDDKSESSLRFVEAEDAAEALARYRRGMIPDRPDFLEHLAGKVALWSFARRFWFATPEELSAFTAGGEFVVSDEEFAERVHAAFGNRRDLARQYIRYQLDSGEPDLGQLPEGLARFVVDRHLEGEWLDLFARPIASLPATAKSPPDAGGRADGAGRKEKGAAR